MIYTPMESLRFLEVINNGCTLHFEDSSFSNDCTDCVEAYHGDILICIGFPNIFGREPQHEQEFNTFVVSYQNDVVTGYLIGSQDSESITSLDEVISLVNKFVSNN